MIAPRAVLALSTVAILLACAATARAQPSERSPSYSVLALGDPASAERVRAAIGTLDDEPFALHLLELPPPPEAGPGPLLDEALAAAPDHYRNGEEEECLGALGEQRRVHQLLAVGRRRVAARVLFWRAACAFSLGPDRRDAAEAAAVALGTLGLELPDDAYQTSSEAARFVDDTARRARELEAAPLRLRSSASRAVFFVDGVRQTCSTPCEARVPPGDHVVLVEAEGFASEWRSVQVPPGGAEESFDLSLAAPDVAAAQWRARYQDTGGVDGAASVRLLARAVRARRLFVILADPAPAGASLRAALTTEGRIAARAERDQTSEESLPASLRSMLREMLTRGGLLNEDVPLLEDPWFWIVSVSALALGAAAVAIGVSLYDPATRIEPVPCIGDCP